jgi:hypothetical protein
MLVFRLTLGLLVLLLLTTAANAQPLTWFLDGVKFDDGGTARGSFNFDPDAGTPCSTGASPCGRFSNVHITTTTGSTRTGATYSFVCGTDVPTCTGLSPDSTQRLDLTTTAANQTGLPGFALFFTNGGGPPAGLTDFGGSIDVSSANAGGGVEGTCADAACSIPTAPVRVTVAGVVGSSETLFQYLFFE